MTTTLIDSSPNLVQLASGGQPRLGVNEVTHLALEGGGGKGMAYLGAIRALEELGVLQRIEGFAGASAGAITAMLLACGMTYTELKSWMKVTDFTSFFDSAEPRTRPESPVPPLDAIVNGRTKEQWEDLLSTFVKWALQPEVRAVIALKDNEGFEETLRAGETQFGTSQAFQAQELKVTGLSLIDFNPPPVGRDRAIRRAYEATMRYFDRPAIAPDAIRDGWAAPEYANYDDAKAVGDAPSSRR